MADIFISYKREDQEEHGRVRPIAEALRAEGYDVFYDVQVPPGSSWEDVLQSKISAARAVIVLWSAHSVESDWVKEEAEMAKHAGKLIPVFLDAVPPPFGFARIEGANLVDWDGDLSHIEWKNLVAAIKMRIGDGEVEAQPGLTRVAYQPSKTVTVTKAAPGKGGGGVWKALAAVLTLAVVGGGAFWAYTVFGASERREIVANEATIEAAGDATFDEARTRSVDERPEPEPGAPPEPAPVSQPGPADLWVRSMQLGADQVEAGGEIRVSSVVVNTGGTLAPGSTAGGYMVDYVLSRDGDAPVRFASFSDTWSEDALLRGGRASNTQDVRPDGGTFSWTETMSVPEGWPAGRFNLCAVADPGTKVAESNESNNVSCLPLQVTAPSAPAGTSRYSVNGVTIRVTDVQPAGSMISLDRQDFAVSFDYSVPAGRRMDILVQPGYTGPGTCRWSAANQPGAVSGTGSQTVRFRFTGEACTAKTLEKVNFRVAPDTDSSDWKSADHPLRYGFRL